MAGWDDYFVVSPVLCPPLTVVEALNSAICERKEVIDSDFYSSCIADNGLARQSVYNKNLCSLLNAGATVFYPNLSDIQSTDTDGNNFYANVDNAISALISSGASGFKTYVKSNGSSFASLNDLAGYAYDGLTNDEKNLTFSALIMGTEDDYIQNRSWNKSTFFMTPQLQASWAIQRRNMLNALVYNAYDATSTGLIISAFIGSRTSGFLTAQEAYNNMKWSSSVVSSGFSNLKHGPDCAFGYRVWSAGSEYDVNVAQQIGEVSINANALPASMHIMPNDYKLVISAGVLSGNVFNTNYDYRYFNNMGISVSSGLNVFTADSDGVFFTFSSDSVTIPSRIGVESDEDDIVEGFRIQSAILIYDYTNNFKFHK